jgi:hypothetical protein
MNTDSEPSSEWTDEAQAVFEVMCDEHRKELRTHLLRNLPLQTIAGAISGIAGWGFLKDTSPFNQLSGPFWVVVLGALVGIATCLHAMPAPWRRSDAVLVVTSRRAKERRSAAGPQ